MGAEELFFSFHSLSSTFFHLLFLLLIIFVQLHISFSLLIILFKSSSIYCCRFSPLLIRSLAWPFFFFLFELVSSYDYGFVKVLFISHHYYIPFILPLLLRIIILLQRTVVIRTLFSGLCEREIGRLHFLFWFPTSSLVPLRLY